MKQSTVSCLSKSISSVMVCALLSVSSVICQSKQPAPLPPPVAGIPGPVAMVPQPFGIVIHGGAGTLTRSELSPELEKEYREKLNEALAAGYKILADSGTSLDAVETAIKILEDSPLFNAGRGAVFAANGKNELDASIMNGKTGAAGAVAGLEHVKNPISLARLVMEKSGHVMMAGVGAEAFARSQGVLMVPQRYFFTERRWRELQAAKAGSAETERDRDERKSERARQPKRVSALSHITSFGTVGAVALDKSGNLAAGTSTGGKTNKRPGRIGDSPIIGAGTYASNESCAISATGDGEFFIRGVVAYDVAALMNYQAKPLKDAARTVVLRKLVDAGGEGGLIGMDRLGNVTSTFNSDGMYRGYMGPSGKAIIKIFKDEGMDLTDVQSDAAPSRP